MSRKLKISEYITNVCSLMVEQYGDTKVEAPAMLEICGVARSTTVKEMNQTELLQYVIAMGVVDNRRLIEAIEARDGAIEDREKHIQALLGRNRATRRHG